MTSTRAALAISLLSLACSSLAPPRPPVRAETRPPRSAAEAPDPSPTDVETACPTVEIADPFEVIGVPTGQGREDAVTIARDLHRLFASVNGGRPDPQLVRQRYDDERAEREEDAHESDVILCVRRIVRARYPHGPGWARVDAEVARGERVHTLELEVWRQEDTFALTLDRALGDLDELERLERARAFVERPQAHRSTR